MTDLEMTKKCAEKMGYRQDRDDGFSRLRQGAGMDEPEWFNFIYNPLHDDAQAMALVKRFGMALFATEDGWCVDLWNTPEIRWISTQQKDLNRAICECVAKMQKAKP